MCQAGAYWGWQLAGDSPPAQRLLRPLCILQWDREELSSWSLFLCSRRPGIRSHQPAQLAFAHRFLTPALDRALQDAHQPLSHLQACQVASRLDQNPTGGPQTHTTIKPQVSPNSSGSSHSLISAATPRFRFSLWNQTHSVTVPGLCTHSHSFLPQKHHLYPSSCSSGYQQWQETVEKEAG